ncbi:prophage tail protein [hydrocarbon metagenome]|uniref:Prophage tail protein n=1 Tax=hydrocarbon metagenome TaxID=938273 RepID=A0A0W8FUN0_9ZZZZ
MKHADALKLLFPLELGGVFATDIELEGKQFDDAQASAELLLNEMLPHLADMTIADWERVCGVTPAVDELLQVRQNRVLARLRTRGGLSLPHFISIAESMGYIITIEELLANTDGCGSEGIFRWRVTTSGAGPVYFRAGRSGAGDRLVEGDITNSLEGIFTDLKPAHTQVIFVYI